MKDYRLFYLPQCPYCKKVRDFMAEKGIELKLEDITDPKVEEELVKLGGKAQVPMLYTGNKAIYESDDIIEFLKN